MIFHIDNYQYDCIVYKDTDRLSQELVRFADLKYLLPNSNWEVG
jgi:hypothetical protein